MTDTFKSNSVEAENNKNIIISAAKRIQEGAKSFVCLTNLSVVEKINDVNNMLNSCNSHYKQLLESHAENIGKIEQEFEDLDINISNEMTLY